MKIKQTSSSSERLRRWQETRALGEARFIWSYGVLRWGGFMFCFTTVFYQYRRYGDVLSTEGNLVFRLLFGATIWAFVGWLYGRSQWRRNEREFLSPKQ